MIFKQDSGLLGLFIGLTAPIIFFYLQLYCTPLIFNHSFNYESMQIFALVINLPFFRYYLIKLNYEKTGKGILFITFIYSIIWIYINQL